MNSDHFQITHKRDSYLAYTCCSSRGRCTPPWYSSLSWNTDLFSYCSTQKTPSCSSFSCAAPLGNGRREMGWSKDRAGSREWSWQRRRGNSRHPYSCSKDWTRRNRSGVDVYPGLQLISIFQIFKFEFQLQIKSYLWNYIKNWSNFELGEIGSNQQNKKFRMDICSWNKPNIGQNKFIDPSSKSQK